MQRIGWIQQRPSFLSSFSVRVRHNSTEVSSDYTRTVKRTVRVPVSRLGDIHIPSAEEIRAKAAATSKPSYTPDISYLDNASTNYLAAKLARLGREEPVEKVTPEENFSQAEETPKEESRPIPTREDIAALTVKRREERMARTLRNYAPVAETSAILRSEIPKSAAFMLPERSPPKHKENLSRTLPRFRGPLRQQEVSPRRVEFSRTQGKKFVKRPEANQGRRRPVSRAVQSANPSISEKIDEAVFQSGGHEPEFNGPERPSSNLLDRFEPSVSLTDAAVVAQSGMSVKFRISADSFYKGDYSRYVSVSKEDYTSPPDALGAVKVAERTLSHQRHYDLDARNRTLELVAQACRSS